MRPKHTAFTAARLAWLVVLLLGVGATAERRLEHRDETRQRGSAPGVRAELTNLECLIEPDVVVDLGSPVSGVIDAIHVERGDRVTPDQKLVELEARVERASVALARAQAEIESEIRSREASLALGRRRVTRKDRLLERRAVSIDAKDEAETEALLAELQLEHARSNQRIAKLELARAQATLERRSIASPISGVVIARMLEPGAPVGEGPILKLARLDPLRVKAIAPASLFGLIEKGMPGEVRAEAPAQGSYQGTVTVVDPIIDAASGKFGVQLELPNPEHRIPAGLKCTVRFTREPGTAESAATPASSADADAG